MTKNKKLIASLLCVALLTGCGNNSQSKIPVTQETTAEISTKGNSETESIEKEVNKVDYKKLFKDLEIAKRDKQADEANPIITQTYGADPFAMEYDGRVYIYMTADAYEKDTSLNIKENSYSKIKNIRVVSTDDMVNFTDHGEIKVAGKNGAASWANNSWAPAAAWKEIDGKPKFFLYFADAGGGIGVVQSDSPTGPFEDPIGHGLVTRQTPNCADITWLFDPAVLVDDDGRAYIYFGGGVPEGKVADPGNARVCELGDDMISLKGEPKLIDVPYLFEDSGIHKANNKYYYTYCTNWQVDEAGTEKYGFTNAQIACLESDSPMGPFKYKETILENPGTKFGLYGNNHHAVFQFKNQWYITYHSRQLEKVRGVEKGYRCTHINEFDIAEDGTIGKIKMNLAGCSQIKNLDPYVLNEAETFGNATGDIRMLQLNDAGDMAIQPTSGSFIQVKGVNFDKMAPKKLTVKMKKITALEDNSCIQVRTSNLNGDILGYIPVSELMENDSNAENDFCEYTIDLDKTPEDVKDLYFIFAGSGYAIDTWQFTDIDNWYDEVITESLISTGTNGRLEKVISKLEAGEDVSVAFIGGSVTEGAGASKITESYADRVAAKLQEDYPKSNITYKNVGLGGTPSALGVMRYKRDILDSLKKTPDIVFVEFAVNDYQEETNGKAYESLVRDILEKDENTAVILVFAVFQSHWNMQDKYIPVGEHYGLPMVSAKNTVDLAYEKEKLNDKEYFSDEYHPTSYGHKIMADCVDYMFEQTALKSREVIVASIPEDAKIGLGYQNMKLITSKDSNGAKVFQGSFTGKDTTVHSFMRNGQCAFPDNWMYEGDGTNKAFEIKANCRSVLLNYKQSSSDEFGTAEIFVDGEKIKEVNACVAGGWNQSIVSLVLENEVADNHTITIKMKDGDENKKFTILGLAYAE